MIYRLDFEVVGRQYLVEYMNADPRYYSGCKQIIPNSEIPDEHWHLVSKETTDPHYQYNQLKEWEKADIEFVRNVKLYKLKSEPEWEEVDESLSSD